MITLIKSNLQASLIIRSNELFFNQIINKYGSNIPHNVKQNPAKRRVCTINILYFNS